MALKNLCFYLAAITSVFILSCSNTSKSTVDKIISTQRKLILPDTLLGRYKSGIDFTAKGNSPVSWTIDIDFDKQVTFVSMDGKNYSLAPVFDKKEINDERDIYVVRSADKLIRITILKELCTTGHKKVSVETDNILYSGCGMYLYDHKLHDTWVLESINNEKQSSKDFKKGLPYVELDLERNVLAGSDGCGKINATVEVQGNRLRFSTFLNPVSKCGHRIEKIFAEMISGKLVNYYEDQGLLVFYLIDDSKLYFRRKNF